GNSRLIDLDAWQWNWVLGIGDGIANHDVGNTRDSNNIAGDSLFGGLAFETDGAQQLCYLDVFDVLFTFVIVVNPRNLLALLDGARLDAQQRDTTQEVRGVQVGNVRLQWCIDLFRWFWQNVVDDIEKRLQRVTFGDICIARVLRRRNTRAARGVQHWQVQQLFSSSRSVFVFEACSNFQQQVLCVRDDFFNTCIGAVGLVNRDDHGKLGFQCLGQHEAGLRKGAFRGIDKQHDAINHGQAALDLAAEIGVARGVNNIDDQIGAIFTLALAVNRSVFGQNGNAALALLVIGVHDAVRVVAVFTECAGLLQHAVDEGGFAVVNVGDDGYITELSGGH